MDLVDEEHVARLERGEDRGDVPLPLERRSRDGADADAELLVHDVREARLAEAGRPDEQQVVERLAARRGGRERDAELLLDPVLADEVAEPARAERLLELLVLRRDHWREKLRHAALFNASRTRSSAESSGSVSASARSASVTL